MKLPAGMMDHDVEFFQYNGELMILHDSKIRSFDHIPARVKYYLEEILFHDPDANLCLDCMNIHDPFERLRQFAFCRYSNFDVVSDLTENGTTNPEFVHCEKRGHCPSEGTLCHSIFKQFKISNREIEVIRLIAKGIDIKMMPDELDISLNTVKTHVQNIRQKLELHSLRDILNWAYKHGIIDEILTPAETDLKEPVKNNSNQNTWRQY